MAGLWREVGGERREPRPAPNIEREDLTPAEPPPSLLSTSEKKSGGESGN